MLREWSVRRIVHKLCKLSSIDRMIRCNNKLIRLIFMPNMIQVKLDDPTVVVVNHGQYAKSVDTYLTFRVCRCDGAQA